MTSHKSANRLAILKSFRLLRTAKAKNTHPGDEDMYLGDMGVLPDNTDPFLTQFENLARENQHYRAER